MSKDDILINPVTGVEFVDVPPKIAAEYLEVSPTFVYEGLKQNRLPIGSAMVGKGGRWSYNIPVERLKNYAKGFDINQISEILKLLMRII